MKTPVGVKVEVDGNILMCANYRTVEENLECITRALYVLCGFTTDPGWEVFESRGAKITLYHSKG